MKSLWRFGRQRYDHLLQASRAPSHLPLASWWKILCPLDVRAAPKKVGANATIVAMGADGKMRTLGEGTNGFTCMPDNPATPGPDPMCMDKAAMEWAVAWIEHKTPTGGKIGFMYMLSGGTDASNTDPYAMKPSAGNYWIKTGPHVMIVGADASFYDMYPKSADPGHLSPLRDVGGDALRAPDDSDCGRGRPTST